jgi:hypothetical protein
MACLDKGEDERTDGSQTKDSVTRSIDTLKSEFSSRVPDQVTNAIKGLVGEWDRSEEFDWDFGNQWQGAKCLHQSVRVKSKADSWTKHIGIQKCVKRKRQGNTSKSVEARHKPGELWLINIEMWGNWSLSSLLL